MFEEVVGGLAGGLGCVSGLSGGGGGVASPLADESEAESALEGSQFAASLGSGESASAAGLDVHTGTTAHRLNGHNGDFCLAAGFLSTGKRALGGVFFFCPPQTILRPLDFGGLADQKKA